MQGIATGSVCDILFERIEKVAANKNGILFEILRNKHLDAVTTYIFQDIPPSKLNPTILEKYLTTYNPIMNDAHLILFFSRIFCVHPSTCVLFKDYVREPGNFRNYGHTDLNENGKYYRKQFMLQLIRECFENFNFEAARLAKNLYTQLCNKENSWKDYVDALDCVVFAMDGICYSSNTLEINDYSKAIIEYIELMEIDHFNVRKSDRNARTILSIPNLIELCDTIFIPRNLLDCEDLLFLFHQYGHRYPHCAKYFMRKCNIDIYGVVFDESSNKNVNMILNYLCSYPCCSADKALGYLFTEFGYQNIDLTQIANLLCYNSSSETALDLLHRSISALIQHQFAYVDVVEGIELLMSRLTPLNFDASWIHQLCTIIRNLYLNIYYTHHKEMSMAMKYLLDHVMIENVPFSEYVQPLLPIDQDSTDAGNFENYATTSDEYMVGVYLTACKLIKELQSFN